MSLRIGLVGCGAAARRYYVPALMALDGALTDVRVVDQDVRRAQSVAEAIGASGYATDYREILDEVDGVIVAVPHFAHYAVAMACLEAGLHVLCEKPLAETAAEVDDMIREADKRRVTISVNSTRRMYPTFQYIKHLTSSGQLGTLQSVQITEGRRFDWDSATGFYVDPSFSKGVTLDLGAHVLDVVCWWVGGKPVLVSYVDDSFGGPESVAHLRATRDGCQIEVKLNRLVDVQSSCRIIGDVATVECDPYGWRSLRVSRKGRPKTVGMQSSAKTYVGLVEEIVSNFIGVIAGREKPLIPALQVRGSIALIEECYSKRGRLPMPWYANGGELVVGLAR